MLNLLQELVIALAYGRHTIIAVLMMGVVVIPALTMTLVSGERFIALLKGETEMAEEIILPTISDWTGLWPVQWDEEEAELQAPEGAWSYIGCEEPEEMLAIEEEVVIVGLSDPEEGFEEYDIPRLVESQSSANNSHNLYSEGDYGRLMRKKLWEAKASHLVLAA